MKVKLKTTRSAPGGDVKHAGEIVDVSNEEAKRLLDSDQAEPVAKKRSQRAEKR